MQITLTTHGGLSGSLHLTPQVVDVETLSAAQAAELRPLVSIALAAVEPPALTRKIPDAMSYTITINDDGQVKTLRQTDTNMSPEFTAMLEWLEQYFARS